MKWFHLSLITPKGILFDQKVSSVLAPGSEGYFGVLAGHAPMLCRLTTGLLTLQSEEGTRLFAVGAGGLEVNRDGVVILVDSADVVTSAQEAVEKSSRYVSPWQRTGHS